ncbi:MAG: ABC transporter substrate-binding protein [bacterium]
MQCLYKIIDSLNKKERTIVLGLVGLIIICFVSIFVKPNQVYVEGIIGSPRYINPVLAQNNDVDLDLTELIFSSLISDLTENYEISDNQQEYTLFLKKDLKWHDSKPITADDIMFTIQIIQDPVYQSPLRINFQGVGIEKIDECTVKFILKDVYAPFLASLDIGILPKHIWQEISPQSFALAEANIKPIGSGSYKFKNLEKGKNGGIKSINLETADSSISIKNIILKFYPNEEALIDAFLARQVDGLSYVSPKNLEKINNNTNIYKITIPRYFAVFFNLDKIKDLKTRQSLAAVVDKQKIIDQVLLGQGQKAGPEYDFEKTNINLSFNLITTSWPELVQTAEILKQEWQEAGAEVEIQIIESNSIQNDYIRPRNYDALLFGEVLSADPDPFAFWHSSQKKDPGLNLSVYDNPKADKLLVDARQTLDSEKRAELYKQFEELLKQDLPAIFLYNSTCLYAVSKKVHGIELDKIALPSKRFENIEQWSIR